MKTRKLGVLILSVILFTLSFGNFVGAEPQLSEKASTLNKLSILIGDGTNFNLNGQLSRSEAITFIVRILGQESYVTTNKAKYAVTPFSDVKSTDWFAATVGYAVEQKIIAGFPDGKFHPSNSISEKAFLKILLGALGYKENTDFTWPTIYNFASAIGLVLPNYASKTEDNLSYTRDEVVGVIYTALNLTNKESNETIIQMLDPTYSLAPELAPTPPPTPTPVPDALVTQITNVSTPNATSISLQLNENIQALNATHISVYETGNKLNKLLVSIASQTETTLSLTTDAQKPNQNYTIELANVIDKLSNSVPLVSSTFVGYVDPTVHSDFFKLSKVVSISKNKINLYFTQPITSMMEDPNNYTIYKDGVSYVKGSFSNMSAKVLSSEENAVTLLLKNDLISSDAKYTINVNENAVSAYNVRLNDGNGETISFNPSGKENASFGIANLQPLDNNTIEITFSDEVDLSTATQTNNFTITNPSGIPGIVSKAIVTGDGNIKGKVVQLQIINSLQPLSNYTLTIKNVMDLTRQNTLIETPLPFSGQGLLARKDLAIINVTAVDSSTLSIYFDRKLDSASALNIGNYSIAGSNTSVVISKIYFDPRVNPYNVKMFLSSSTPLAAGATYNLQVFSTMADELGKTSMTSANKDFVGTSNAVLKPIIYQAKIVGKDVIRFSTNVEIAGNGANLVASNYWVQYTDGTSTLTKQATNVNIVNGTTGVINFSNLDISKTYTLMFSSLTDYSTQYTRTVGDGMNYHTVSLGQ